VYVTAVSTFDTFDAATAPSIGPCVSLNPGQRSRFAPGRCHPPPGPAAAVWADQAAARPAFWAGVLP
jgi:hypothetical protein